ncbi:dicarboxylate/amino acid:cation symporter [Novosphingobium sp. 1949]|uniref:Dicarboxylate/amino acid:cation symporter n=1 Tax=Novosphingobium organovorum TaxID=2930092 RepID=A0ABT0BFP7_9SPHN|nr:dicarboxylate/amino acid:cation symporter [Novosphingobium organovorum]MCJ2183678.1 dicarboxylate/amino acid:cation symporter [Novosphingobium organovorum]
MTDASSASRMPEIKVPGLLTLGGLVAGFAVGLVLTGMSSSNGSVALDQAKAIAGPIGTLWLQGLQMTILPLVAGMLFTGIMETARAASASAIAKRTISWIVGTLALSSVIGALVMTTLIPLFDPPRGFHPPADSAALHAAPSMGDFFKTILPTNVLESAANGAMLPVILFIAIFALAATRLDEAPRRQLALVFEGLAGAMMVVIGWVLKLAPIGVFALGLTLAASNGFAAIGALAQYIVLVASCGFVLLLLAYPIAALIARKPLGAFFSAVLPAQVVAISTQSSLASLPAMLAACRKLDVRGTSAEFVLPIAVTLFRATSPAMNVGVAIYAAHIAGVPLSMGALAAGVVVAFITTFGSASVPGTITFILNIAPVAAAMGVPLWPLGILVAVEMLPDIMRTVGNVTMDVAVTSAVDTALDAPEEGGVTLH